MNQKTLLIYALIALLFFSANKESIAQELVFNKKMALKRGIKDKRDILPIVLDDNSTIMFFLDNSEIKLLSLDRDFQEAAEFSVPRPKTAFTTLLGYSYFQNEYCLFLSNKKKTEFFAQFVNLDNQQTKNQVLNINLKKEKFLEAVSHNNKFYILTVKKSTSILKLYEFQGSDLKVEKEFDFSRKITSVHQNFILTEIAPNNPISIEVAANERKLYTYDGKIFITIDKNINQTKIIIFDLNTYESSYHTIEQESIRCENVTYIVSNSFLVEEVLFQVKSCNSALSLKATNINTKKPVAKFFVTQDEEIQFKNGPIKQEGSLSVYGMGKDKELSKTKTFLRRLSKGRMGISAHRTNNNITLTIGGLKEVQQGLGGTTYTPGSSISTPYGNVNTPGRFEYNPMMDNYYSFKLTRAVHFNSVLDDTSYEHKEVEVVNTAFDKIRDFEDSLSQLINNQTLFRIQDEFFFGYYDEIKRIYSIKKFSDD